MVELFLFQPTIFEMTVSIEKFFVLSMIYLFGMTNLSLAHQDTLFINELGVQVSRGGAMYYRMISPIESYFEITDIDLNNIVRRRVFYTSPQAVIKEGRAIYFDENGKRIEEGYYSKGLKQGEWSIYYSGGEKRKQTITYYADKRYYIYVYDSISGKLTDEGMMNQYELKTGSWKSYYFKSDSLEWLNTYNDGKKEGEQIQYYKNGSRKRVELYVNNNFKKGKQYDENEKEIKYYPSFEYPQPPVRLRQYLYTRVSCFESTLRMHDMILKCKITADGTMSDIAILYCKNPDCELEIKKELSKLKKWKPAKVERKPIVFSYEYKLKYYVPRD